MKDFISQRIQCFFSLDYRSLALLRIGIGLTVIADLLFRAMNLFAHYSDKGVLPRSAVLEHWTNQWLFSLHFFNGSVWFSSFLFVVAGICALSLALGYRTRVATIVSWILLASLHVREPLVLQGGDTVLRAILFWMMFLPTAKRYSLDRFLNRIAPPEKVSVSSTATLAYIVQICLVFFFSGLLKTGASWRDGSAGYLALSLDQFVTSFGVYLKKFPSLLTWGTYAVRYVEIFAPFLFFIPFRSGFFRIIGIILLSSLIVVFNVSLHLGMFGTIVIVCLFGLLPTGFWDWIGKLFEKVRSKNSPSLTLYYDADCTFCFKATHLIRRLFLHPDTHIASAKADSEISKCMEEKNSWVIVDGGGEKYFEWEGATRIIEFSYLSFLVPILKLNIVSYLGTKVYRVVANRRKKVCSPILSTAPKKYSTVGEKVKKYGVLFLLMYVIIWNIDGAGLKLMPEGMKWIGYATRLDQKFNFFAPAPLTEDGWYVIPGMLRDTTTVDVYTGKPLTYERPESLLYEDQRWQKYMMNIWNKDNKKFRLYYGKYLCREWNKTHPKEKNLMRFNIIFMLEKTPKQGEVPALITPTNIWQHSCF